MSEESGSARNTGRRFKKDAMLSHQQDVELCQAVAEYPCVYDPTHPRFKDVSARDEVWESIGILLSLPGEVCKRRWRNIRDCYRRNKRWEKKDGGPKPSKRKKWFLSDHLEFLDSAEDDIGSTTNVEENDSTICEDEDENENSVSLDADEIDQEKEPKERIRYHSVYDEDDQSSGDPTDVLELSTSAPAATSSRRGGQRRAVKRLSRVTERILDPRVQRVSGTRRALEEAGDARGGLPLLGFLKEEPKSEDDTDVFFRSMAMTAKRLHPAVLARLKKQVCNLVMDVQLENSSGLE